MCSFVRRASSADPTGANTFERENGEEEEDNEKEASKVNDPNPKRAMERKAASDKREANYPKERSVTHSYTYDFLDDGSGSVGWEKNDKEENTDEDDGDDISSYFHDFVHNADDDDDDDSSGDEAELVKPNPPRQLEVSGTQ